MKRLILTLTFLGVLIASVAAQGPPPDRRGGPPPGQDREKLRERIEMVRMWKLVETLELTEEQSMRFFPVFNSFETAAKGYTQENLRLLDRLEEELIGPETDSENIGIVLDSLLENRKAEFESEIGFYENVSEILSVEQRAKLALFKRKFEEEVRKLIKAGSDAGHFRPQRP